MTKKIFLFLSTFIFTSIVLAQVEFAPAASNGSIDLVSGSQTIYITNKNVSPLSLNLSISQPGVSITSNRCTSPLAQNRNCYIMVSVSSALMATGDTSFALMNGSSSLVNLKFSKAAPVESSEFSPTSSSISDFSQQTISIKNQTLSNKSYSPSFSGADASKFEIVLNRCSNIAPGSSCNITYKLKSVAAGSYSASMTEPQVSSPASLSASISGSVPGVIVPPVKSLQVSTNSIDFGTLTRYGVSNPLVVNVTNTGNVSISPVLTFSSKLTLVLNRCSTILAGQSCSISLGMNPDSAMANGPISGQSLLIKADASDVGQTVSASGILSVAFTCPLNQHYEGGSCISNVRSCPIPNGVGSQTYAASAWGSCQVVSCNSSFYQDGQSCLAINYVATFSSYSPAIPSGLVACDGSTVSNRTITSCKQAHDNAIVSNSLCSDPSPSVTTQSPAGSKFFAISNGSEMRSCALGSSTQTFESRSCDSGFYDNSVSCVAITYTPTYSAYSPAIPTLNICDGSVTSTRTIVSCLRNDNTQFVATTNCSDPAPSVTTQSPAGQKSFSIANGSEQRSCPLGSSTQTFVSRSCNTDFHDTGSACIANVYVATYSAYSPAIPTLNTCDGTVVSNRTITACTQQDNSQSVAIAKCSDPTPTVTTQSPAGTKNVSISNGSETYSCPLGSSTQTFVSRSCNSTYYDTGSACALITYTPTYSAYSSSSNFNRCIIWQNN